MIDLSHPDVIDTIRRQYAASSPDRAAWVSANAGAGKTHVLTQRVIRLLIGDEAQGLPPAEPSKIVCITYTKAAAAEMADRLFKRLSGWALASEAELAKDLENVAGRPLTPLEIVRSRRLFAQALETPGGLKIQTIHSFCEAILRRFPVEAGIMPGFEIMDDLASAEAFTAALDQVMATAKTDAEIAAALQVVFNELADENARNGALRMAMADETPADDAALRRHYGLPGLGEPDDWKREALARLDRTTLRTFARFQGEPSATHQKKIDVLKRVLDAPATPALFDEVAAACLKQDGDRPKPLRANKKIDAVCPDYQARWEEVFDVLHETVIALAGVSRYALAKALAQLGTVLAPKISHRKSVQGWLDFDDLIARTAALFRQVGSEWVMYKLDLGIEHLLLDEAQDTGNTQWQVVEQFCQEFAAGVEARGRRTAFVVGDKKQSIYSFQGADARLFAEKREELGAVLSPAMPFEQISMPLSFRSSQAVLDVVDAVFSTGAGKGVHEGDLHHKSALPGKYGAVTWWPYLPKRPDDEAELWDLPVDSGGAQSPERMLADQICADIKKKLDGGTLAEGAPIKPGDILILCQRRARQFHEILSGLGRFGIPTAGADRVALKEDVAVRDMLALLRFITNKEDSLSLAELLTSPLFGMSHETLFGLAHDRGARSLWSALRDQDDPRFKAITARIDQAERIALEEGPYAVLSHMLEAGQPNGWRLFRQRLGAGSDEALEELLNEAISFEGQSPRTLQGFLGHLERLDSDVKKEASEGGDVVRVMTVHGAKGLEAPIVYLADATRVPRPRGGVIPNLTGKEGAPAHVILTGGATLDSPEVRRARAAKAKADAEEYRRLLYVALTRAAEQVVVCGVETKAAQKEAGGEGMIDPETATWHGLVRLGLQHLADQLEEVPDRDGALRLASGRQKIFSHPEADQQDVAPPPADPPIRPDWLFQPVPKEAEKTIAFPSGHDAATGDGDTGPVWPPRAGGALAAGLPVGGEAAGGEDPRRRGTLIHSLLELLPSHPKESWATAAAPFLAALAPDLPEAVREGYVGEVLAVLGDPTFSDVFSPEAQAEVAVRGTVAGIRYSGQIDRLFVTSDQVLIVDYKTHRPPPTRPEDVPRGIVRQMAIYKALVAQIYPDRAVEAAVLWTHAPRLMALPPEMLAPG